MKLTKDQIKHVAKLANLPLSSGEEEKYSGQLSKILEYVEQLNKVDTSDVGLSPKDVEPTFNVSGQANIEAEDELGECLSQEDALSNIPKKNNGFFVTEGVFQEEDLPRSHLG